jgi:predicted phosphoribosyltransferase
MFDDRTDAGRQLAARLERFRDEAPVVLALPRGGVPVGFEVATALGAPLDLVLVRKIGAPFQRELAVGAVVDGERPVTVVNEEIARMLHLPDDYMERESRQQLAEIERRREMYLSGLDRPSVRDATIIIVDDGIATGATVRAAVQAMRQHRPRRLVVAVPVAPPDAVAMLEREADEVICLDTPADFGAIGYFYRDFHQVPDDEVVALLRRAARDRMPESPPPGGGP